MLNRPCKPYFKTTNFRLLFFEPYLKPTMDQISPDFLHQNNPSIGNSKAVFNIMLTIKRNKFLKEYVYCCASFHQNFDVGEIFGHQTDVDIGGIALD